MIKDDIIDYIRRNRCSTTEVADCMGKSGVISGVSAINKRHFRAGTVKWVYAHNNSNWSLHEQIRDVREGEVVLVSAFSCDNRGVLGELVTKYLTLYKQAAAIVVLGKLRDAHKLTKENYPIWSEGFNPAGCFNTNVELDVDEKEFARHKSLYENSIAVCDDGGVVIIPKELHTAEFLQKLEAIEEQEDIWFECLDRRKWDTFDIVCKKRYLEENCCE